VTSVDDNNNGSTSGILDEITDQGLLPTVVDNPLVDQAEPVIGSGLSGPTIGGGPQQRVAQVLTVGVTGTLAEVRVPVFGPGPVTIEIQGVTGNCPGVTGNVCPDGRQVVIPAQTFTLAPQTDFVAGMRYRFRFDQPAAVVAGTQIAIVLSSTDTSGTTAWPYGPFEPPTSGQTYRGGDAWFTHPNMPWSFLGVDLPFETLVVPSPVIIP